MKIGSALLLVCCCLATEAALTDALIDRDNGPLTGLFGFPDSREGGRLADAGDDVWEFCVTASSHSTRDTDGGESILFDGETRRLGLSYRRRVSERLELGVEIPWISHESGSLDGFIDRWHSIFGLPNGIRNERPKDQLLFSYEDNGRQFSMTSNTHGAGDVRLLGGWLLTQSAQSSSALRFSVKLPTGDSDRLLGSGSTDVSLGIAGDGRRVMGIEKLSGFYRTSATWLGSPDFDTLRIRRVVGQVSAGVGYDLTARTTVALQMLLRSPVYDSGVSPLGDVAASLTMGVRFRLPQEYDLSVAVAEDVHPGSLPDVTFVLSLQKLWHKPW
jgi:hypothetical protein